MPLTLLTTAVLAGVELAINNVLKLDTASQKKLAKIDGAVLLIECLTPDLEIFLVVRDQHLHLYSYYEEEVDARISGQSTALLKLLFAKDKNHAFYDEGLEIKGEIGLLQTLQKTLTDLNIDWEYHLSKFIGDIPTQTFSEGLSTAKDLAQNTHESLLMDIDEYIHEEKKLFPAANELASFYQSIDQLRLKVDRAEAKLNFLETNKVS
jgi:ubiquinone biosynthesis accessory factor UbiJ